PTESGQRLRLLGDPQRADRRPAGDVGGTAGELVRPFDQRQHAGGRTGGEGGGERRRRDRRRPGAEQHVVVRRRALGGFLPLDLGEKIFVTERQRAGIVGDT